MLSEAFEHNANADAIVPAERAAHARDPRRGQKAARSSAPSPPEGSADQPRRLPPVRRPTSATIFAATASIS